MHDDELWQVFSQNGEPIIDKGENANAFDSNKDLVSSNAHVWLWRDKDNKREILLQKRSLSVTRKPGYLNSSAAGHINISESAVVAAVRETQEELGIKIEPAGLYLVHTTRTVRNLNDLKHVYIYNVANNVKFSFDDGEVDSVTWYSLDYFREMTNNPDEHKLVDQGRTYFDILIAAIERQ